MSILIISSHPNLTQSVANQIILEHLKTLLPTAEFVHLDSQYPDFRIDGAAELYQPEAAMHHTVEQFLPAFQQLAFLCRMEWQPPVYSNGMTTIPNVSTPEQIVEVQAKAVAHAERLAAQLQK